MTRYRLADPTPTSTATALAHLDTLTQQLLHNRNITEAASADWFLEPDYERSLHDPFLLHQMSEAVERILLAIKNDERIAIFSDYDCDGIPGAVILHDFFMAIGFTNFTNYIPHRHFEGFGVSEAAVEKLAADGVQLMITIDCGTSDVEATAVAIAAGIDVVITDHHEPKAVLPAALAIVNPKLGDTYPFDGLCGAGVIFKVVQALIERGHAAKQFSVPVGYEKWWLDMVGIATIADMVPLLDENRVFARYGLQVLRKSRRPGLQQLLRKNRASQRHLTEDDIGFTIGPRINAASRMGSPQEAFQLLSTRDEGLAGAHVDSLEKLNNERKGLVATMTKEIHAKMKRLDTIPDVIVMGNPDWRPSLVGLAANKLAEEYNKPAFLWGRDGHGVIKGSCRSNGTVSVVRLMESLSETLLEHGGHHMSGGFAVADEHIHTFSGRLHEAYQTLGEAALIDEEVVLDATLTLEDINRDLLRVHAALAPFGHSNPKPLYEFKNITPTEVHLFGKGKEHLKLNFMSRTGAVEAIAFFRTEENWTRRPEAGASLTLIGHVEQSFFMGRMQTRIRIIDIL